jgi:hypothetical protein
MGIKAPRAGGEQPLQDPAKTPENAESDAQPDARQTADPERQDSDPSAGETKDLSGLLNQQLADLPEELQGAFKILLQYAANRSQK